MEDRKVPMAIRRFLAGMLMLSLSAAFAAVGALLLGGLLRSLGDHGGARLSHLVARIAGWTLAASLGLQAVTSTWLLLRWADDPEKLA
jgi:hypothetical protein